MPSLSNRDTEKRARRSSPVISHEVATDINYLIEVTSGSLTKLLQKIVPTELKAQLKLALDYAEGKSDLVQAITQTKVDFYSAGFAVGVQPKRKTSLGSFKQRIGDFIREHQLKAVADELTFDYCATDNAILVWKAGDEKLDYVTTVQPHRVDFDNSTGQDTLKIDLDPAVVEKIRKTTRALKRGEDNPYPDKYVRAALSNKPVELSHEDGEYWIVKSKCRRFTGLAVPSMKSVFGDVQLRDLLVSGDWSVAYFVKNLIQQVKAGEPIPSGPLAGTKNNYVTKSGITKLKKAFQDMAQVLRVFTDHTVDIKYHVPDPAVFNPAKYTKVEERVLRWGGVIDVLMTGSGEGYSQGYLGKSRFEAQGKRVREAIGWVFETFFMHPSVSEVLAIPEGSAVTIGWDMQNLKDWRQVQEELRFQMDHGGMDWETAHERLGERHDQIKDRKVAEQDEEEIWKPLFEPRQGLLTASSETEPVGGQKEEDIRGAPGAPAGRPQTRRGLPLEAPRPTRGGT